MSQLTLYGFAPSTYTRTARMACVEKGVPYDLQPSALGKPAYAALHPFHKMPALTHGDVRLFETMAIIRYIDEAFDGPALQPSTPAARARMAQWESVVSSYTYRTVISKWVLAAMHNNPAEQIAEAAKAAAAHLTLIDGLVGDSAWLAGDQLSLADLTMAPVLAYVAGIPEGAAMMAACPNLSRVYGAISARESFTATG
ncbi:MAG: glutathione S-transferase family protein [Alphaproteobacteria bacterium]|nr:glutathione S-transferase family protein [Alphaproteobacteria bacterium]